MSVGDEVKLFLSDDTFEKFSQVPGAVQDTDNDLETSVNSFDIISIVFTSYVT